MRPIARNRTKRNEIEQCKVLVKHGNFYVPPPGDDRDFKQLFEYLASVGAGRKVGEDGNAVGPWTPELLAQAISQIDSNEKGVDLRTVQLWFQSNDKGIGTDNILWLARIFGCGDPEATLQWRAELSAANRRLAAKRKEKKSSKQAASLRPEDDLSTKAADHVNTERNNDSRISGPRFNLAQKTEAIFGSQSSMALPLVIFTGACALALIAFTLNIHSVLYAPEGGHTKQVGFLWAPNWTIVFIALLPLFLSLLIELLRCWKEEWRPELVTLGDPASASDSWGYRLRAASYIFWTTIFITVALASVYNWTATHLSPLLNGDTGSWPVDWGRIAIVRPELISVPSATAFSGLVFLYNGFAAYFFFAGHILLHLMKHDYLGLAKRLDNRLDTETGREFQSISLSLMYGIYRCTALGVVITIMMKLQSSFLQSDSSNLITWLVADVQSLFETHHYAGSRKLSFGIAPGFYYSFFCLLAIVGVFANASIKIRWMMGRLEVNQIDRRFFSPWAIMDGSMALLVISYFLIGAVPGFSIFLLFTLVVTGYLLTKPASPWGQHSRYERQT